MVEDRYETERRQKKLHCDGCAVAEGKLKNKLLEIRNVTGLFLAFSPTPFPVSMNISLGSDLDSLKMSK